MRRYIVILFGVLAGIGAVWGGISPSALRVFFCIPSAESAAILLGAATEPTGEGVRILSHPAIHVTLACSGLHYFFITSALLVYVVIQHRRWSFLAAVVPLAYLLTLLANTGRIVCGWYTRVLAVRFLSDRWYGVVHMATGTVCFLMVLLMALIFIQRSWSHDAKRVAS